MDSINLKADEKTRFYLINNKKTTLEIHNTTQIIPKYSNNTELQIDLIKNEKRARGSIKEINEKTISSKIKSLQKLTTYNNKKFFEQFPEAVRQEQNYKTEYTEFDLTEIEREFRDHTKDLLKDKTIKKVMSKISQNTSKTQLFAKELEYGSTNNFLSLGISAIVNDRSSSSHSVDITTEKDYDVAKLFDKLKETIKMEKNPESTKEKYSEFIITPTVFEQLIDYFILQNINLEDLKLNNNYIAKNWGKQIFDEKLTIAEDPFIDYSPFSDKYDFEFSRTTKKEIIKNGIAKSFFADLADAYKYKSRPTGNWFFSNSETNITVEPGTKKLDKLISETKKGIIIRDIIGLHTANKTEGELTVPAGIANEIVNGEIKRNVKNVPLVIKISDLLNGIEISKERNQEDNFLLPYIKKVI
ncbi:MAG: metallopeptidase TldD-related protein [Candidatus ainarchaeum sp.]|nr:metallopeptidase TldD-related protein [Candidatus ainarchaeum sp.]